MHTYPLRGIWQITEEPDQMLSLLEKKELYLPYLETITNKTRKQEWLAARLLLKELSGEELLIRYHSNGMPYLPDSQYNISISHTKGYVAVILTEEKAAGIDIEYRSGRALKLKARFMSEKELNALSSGQEEVQTLLHWSAKEVLFKMMGEEDVDFRQHLHIEPFPLETEGVIKAYETRTTKLAVFTLSYEVKGEYVCVWS